MTKSPEKQSQVFMNSSNNHHNSSLPDQLLLRRKFWQRQDKFVLDSESYNSCKSKRNQAIEANQANIIMKPFRFKPVYNNDINSSIAIRG